MSSLALKSLKPFSAADCSQKKRRVFLFQNVHREHRFLVKKTLRR